MRSLVDPPADTLYQMSSDRAIQAIELSTFDCISTLKCCPTGFASPREVKAGAGASTKKHTDTVVM